MKTPKFNHPPIILEVLKGAPEEAANLLIAYMDVQAAVALDMANIAKESRRQTAAIISKTDEFMEVVNEVLAPDADREAAASAASDLFSKVSGITKVKPVDGDVLRKGETK